MTMRRVLLLAACACLLLASPAAAEATTDCDEGQPGYGVCETGPAQQVCHDHDNVLNGKEWGCVVPHAFCEAMCREHGKKDELVAKGHDVLCLGRVCHIEDCCHAREDIAEDEEEGEAGADTDYARSSET
eukprot:Rhum_TRINITY_DN19059_c0_g1::Rhum_TRINITY_DN19059_c0_g1_i1::g.169153::m.169153